MTRLDRGEIAALVYELHGDALDAAGATLAADMVAGVTVALETLAVPAGFERDAMPIGMQLVGPPLAEARLLRIAATFEAEAGLTGRRPSL